MTGVLFHDMYATLMNLTCAGRERNASQHRQLGQLMLHARPDGSPFFPLSHYRRSSRLPSRTLLLARLSSMSFFMHLISVSVILTGVLLGVVGIAPETAPLNFLSLVCDCRLSDHNNGLV